MILTIYDGSPLLLLFFGISKKVTAEKTHPRVTTDRQTNENEKCENYYTHKFLSIPFVLHIITKTVRFNYIQFSQKGITRNTTVR